MRRLALLLALLACIPAPAAAQLDAPAARARLTVTPYTGVRGPYGGGNVVQVFLRGSEFLLQQERSGSGLLGADVALRVYGPISVVGGATYTRTGEVRYFRNDTSFFRRPDLIHSRSDAMAFAKLGLSARFESPASLTDVRRRPSTDLVVAAAVVEEFDELHPALNFGFQGALPVARGVEFVIGLEDYLVLWRQEALAPSVGAIVQRFYPDDDVQGVTLHYDMSNIFHIRLGSRIALW